jgi:hypothetical protein
MWMFCRSLFVLLYFFFWQLCRLVFFDIRILITPLVSSNSSNRGLSIDASYQFLLIWLSGFWDDFFFTEIDQPKQKLPMATMFVNWSARWAKISTCLVNQNKSKQWQLQNAISSGKRLCGLKCDEKFETDQGVIRSRKLNTDIQYNGQKSKQLRANYYTENTRLCNTNSSENGEWTHVLWKG